MSQAYIVKHEIDFTVTVSPYICRQQPDRRCSHWTDLQRVVLRHQLFDGEELPALVLKRSSVWCERMKSAWSHSLKHMLLMDTGPVYMSTVLIKNVCKNICVYDRMQHMRLIKLLFGHVSSRAPRTLVSVCLSVRWLVYHCGPVRRFSSVLISKGLFLLTFPLVPSSGQH